ncbi:hypothetical protein ASPCADRAFT_156177 [Aspergillus carbonarius ITEM 5010]|uniref:Uncharacterized protein n=1 Tax=Aspergillus carbonarius (strain ITEM 5010) TaxID=602072 RepID=A0A1R3R8P8_ASPC5|nr:hypothetical protein ASPCADRAFT_156177 [Aspergillus carbonarius ITEM 5010]
MIYMFVVASTPAHVFDPTTHPYPRQALYCRPGFPSPRRISVSLLQTCQRIYTEAALLPAASNTHTFWSCYGPPHARHSADPAKYFARMTAPQREAVSKLQFFTQEPYLKSGLRGILQSLNYSSGMGICLKKLTLTLRHSDWLYWELNWSLAMDPFRGQTVTATEIEEGEGSEVDEKAWGTQFVYVPALEELVIQLETVMDKRDQLDAIVRMARTWRFPLVREEGWFLVYEEEGERACRWIGVTEEAMREEVHRGWWPGQVSRKEWEAADAEEWAQRARSVPKFMPLRAGEEVDYDPSIDQEFYFVSMTWKRHRMLPAEHG